MAELKLYLLCQYAEYSRFLPFSVSPTELPFSSPQSSRDCTAMIWNRYFLFNALTCDHSIMITPSWSLIVQLRAYSKPHSFAILLRDQLGQCQSSLNDQTSIWQWWVSNWYQYHHKKFCFRVFQICFLRIGRRFITHAWNLASGQSGFWFARGIRQKVLLKSRNSVGMGRAFDLENLLKERKEAVLSVNAKSRLDGVICFLKGGNVILSDTRIQLTVTLIFPTFNNKDQLFTVSIKCKK